MKVIKKITAMMLSIMMVLGMCSVVSAEGTTEKGTITINNAISGQTYKIYKILDLESYESKKDETENEIGLYSYKPATGWADFFKTGAAGAAYVTVNKDGYVEWKADVETTKAAELAQKALAYATDSTNSITAVESKNATAATVTFENLDLGYYLVDSSAGALCSLDTTNPNATIKEKNEIPTVEKSVYNEATGTTESGKWQERNFANIGDTVKFQTTITTKNGAENYILHDKMDEGFTLIQDTIKVKKGNTEYEKNTDYEVTLDDTKGTDANTCTFHITFKDPFYVNLAANTKVVVTYEAMLNEKAFIGHNQDDNSGNKNVTWLSYGDSKNTIESKTDTYTYQIPVFKYTIKDGTETGLAKAKFTLSTDKEGNNKINFVKEKAQDGYEIYRVARSGETGTIDTIETVASGKFKIKGIHGQCYLTEIEAPKGYNKLADPKKIKVSELNIILVDDKTNSGDIKILNQSGSLLPYTGGVGTTIFYIAGALLVLAAGVVLIAKKRTNAK